MKKQLYFGILTIIILTCTFKVCAQVTIPLTITPPSQTGLCLDNNFSASFTATGQHRLTIAAQLIRDGNPDTVFYCSDPIQKPKLFIVVDSLSTSISNTVTDTASGTWTGTLDTNAKVTIWYHVYLDCSSINWPNAGTSNLNLVQTFTDSLNYFYDTGSGTNTFESSNLPGLRMIAPNNLSFSTSYLNTTFLTFRYINTGNGSADINFAFTPDTTGYCGQVTYDSLKFAVGINGNFQPFLPMTLTQTSLNGGDTLFIRQQILTDTCITYCDSARVSFNWQCAQSPATDSIFCNNCTTPLNTNFILQNANQSVVGIQRIIPILAEATFDNTCFNDTVNMMNWHFQITNDGVGALDSVQIVLTNADSIEFLSLIPQHTFSINSTCTNCVDTLITYQRTNYLCQNLVPDALRSATFRLLDFRETDTVNVYFRTFRCASSDTLLFNIPKVMNSWGLRVLGKGICQDTAVHNLVGTPFFGHLHLGSISGHVPNGSNDLSLNTVFTPIISDLTVPQDSVFGQSATFEVEFNGGISGNDRQVLGCLSAGCTSIHGFLKATIKCEQGLVVRHPASDVRIKMYHQPSGSFLNLNPVYHHTLTPADVCQQGEYSYYFDLSNPVFKNVLDSGRFEFTLQSCCEQIEPTLYSMEFSILPDPDSCLSLTFPPGDTLEPVCAGLGCEWIPLRKTGEQINVHCPGCKIPGMIVDNYLMRRTTFGLQDSDNDGLADSAAVMVNADTAWFNSHGIKTWHSTIGDELEDLLVSHLQQGDATNGGYEYTQMFNLGARFNFLQLRRDIPTGLDTMKLTPVAFTFYVDSTDLANPDCRDCVFFGVDSTRYRTMLQIQVDHTDTLFNTFLELIPAENRLLFSFESSLDSLSNHTGNLHDHDSLIIHADTQLPFRGFFENQQYRLHVTYRQCGTLITSMLNLNSQTDISTSSAIKNVMWMSGVKQNHNAYPNLLQPEDTTSLQSAGWTFDPFDQDTTLTLIDSAFSNQYVFYCSGYGRIHYFYFQNITFSAAALNDTTCGKKLSFSCGIRTRASNIKAFPYEYRPTPLWHNHMDVMVPSGYFIAQARVRSGYFIPPAGYTTAWQYFIPPGTTGNVSFSDSSWMKPVTFFDHLFPLSQTDSNLYVMSETSNFQYELLLSTDSCIMLPQVYPDSSIVYNFGLTPLPFTPFDSTFCQPDPPIVRSSFQTNSQTLVTLPNLSGYFSQPEVYAENHLVCFDNLTITNVPMALDSPATVYTTGAPFVFLALPDSSTVPFLQGWFYHSSGDTIYPSGNIIPLDSWLPTGSTITGNVCAYYNPCQDSIAVPFHVGWNCDGFPSAPFHTDSVCGSTSLFVEIIDEPVAMFPIGKNHPDQYTLCQLFEISAPFASEQNGGFIPQSLILNNMPPGLMPVYALILSCDSTLADTIQLQTQWIWNISGSNLTSVGILDSALNANECLHVTIGLMPDCEYAGTDFLPTMTLFGQTFCGDTLSFNANFSGPFAWDSTSQCTDCFTLSKTALQDTVFVGDTATFQIVVCGTNALSQTLAFSDLLPVNFSPLASLPDSITVPAIGCDTLFISGTYAQAGFCTDSSMWNTATIYFAGDSLSSQACINVYPPCVAGLNFYSVPDSTFTSSIPATVTGQIIFLEGKLYVDDLITFVNCSIFVNTGGQIILLPGGSIILDSTIIQGCDFMWQGILTDTLTSVAVTNGSTIRDANRGVEARDGSTLKITHSAFEDNVRGIFVPENPGGNNVGHAIYGNRFGLFASSLKPAYPGQTPFGSVPYAGIEVNDVVMTIGTNEADSNWFYNMNIGVVGHRSVLTVANNKFSQIWSDTMVTTPVDWDGAAIASVGKLPGSPGKLTVIPLASNDWTVDTCQTGVYTHYSNLDVRRTKMRGLETGVYSQHCTNMYSSLVDNCTILSKYYGIDWRLNAGASEMIARNNEIEMNGSKLGIGINLEELNTSGMANYLIEDNFRIDITSAYSGIQARNVFNPVIKNNYIIQNNNGVNYPVSYGMKLENDSAAQMSCNTVLCTDSTYSSTYGIHISQSPGNDIFCNTIETSNIGFHFIGLSPGTRMRANIMEHNFQGLELHETARIGVQNHHGNLWFNYRDTIGAVNWDTTALGQQASEFRVHTSMGTQYFPVIPTWNAVWFVPDPGSPQTCGNYCQPQATDTSRDEQFERSIAEETFEFTIYEDESKELARQYLFGLLEKDSILRMSDFVYESFYDDHISGSIGLMNEVFASIKSSLEFDSVFKLQVTYYDSLIKSIENGIRDLDSLAIQNPGTDYSAQRLALMTQWIANKTVLQVLFDSQNSAQAIALSNAQAVNSNIITSVTAQSNETFINEMNILYLKHGKDTLTGYYSQILDVAIQCPLSGGPSVYRARTLVGLFTKLMEYDDETACDQTIISRGTKSNMVSRHEPQVKIQPNPASNQIDVHLLNYTSERICQLEISDSKGSIRKREFLICNVQKHKVDISELTPGVYWITVVSEKITSVTKLIVVR